MGPTTLAEKVTAILMLDDSGEGFVGQCHQHTGLSWQDAGEFSARSFELDLLDWGATYGMAFGIARTENPFESVASVAARAADAATIAWERYAGGRPIARPCAA